MVKPPKKQDMKREIKFRGKRVDNGKWIEGDLCNFLGGNGKCIMPKPYYATRDFGEETEQGVPVIDEGVAMGAFYPVHAETVGQYTGLKENAYEQADLNKPIYDGDIVEFIDGRRLFVLWNDDTCQFEFSDGLPINSRRYYNCHKRIVGNVTDNPELLK